MDRRLLGLVGLAVAERLALYGGFAPLLLEHLSALGPARFPIAAEALSWMHGPLADIAVATRLYGLHNASVFGLALVAAPIADRLLGPRRVAIAGAIALGLGMAALSADVALTLALGLVALGRGAIGVTLAPLVSTARPPGDPRRDRAFLALYAATNLGALGGPILRAQLGTPPAIFLVAALVTLVALGVFLLPSADSDADADEPSLDGSVSSLPSSAAAATVAIVCAAGFVLFTAHLVACHALHAWAPHLDRTLVGIEVPAAYLEQLPLNGAMVLALAPLLAFAWTRLGMRMPSELARIAAGAALFGIASLVMIAPATSNAAPSAWWVIGATAILTLGELLVGPAALSLLTATAPRWSATAIALWLIARDFLIDYSAPRLFALGAETRPVALGMDAPFALGLPALFVLLALACAVTAGVLSLSRRLLRPSS